jgi:hypothetical protein
VERPLTYPYHRADTILANKTHWGTPSPDTLFPFPGAGRRNVNFLIYLIEDLKIQVYWKYIYHHYKILVRLGKDKAFLLFLFVKKEF